MGLLIFFSILLSVGYAVYSAYCTWAFFRARQGKKCQSVDFPAVSMITPAAGMEEGYLENFISYCMQDYPVFELIVAIPPGSEGLIGLLEELKSRFPRVDMSWVLADSNRGPNHKVGNLIAAVKEAKHSVLVISDSDMRVSSQYLKQTVTPFLQKGAGLVTALYRNIHLENLWSALQALTVQTIFVPNVLFSRKVEGMSYAFGATLCTSKEVLASLGGIDILLDYLADDYQMGYRVRDKGYDIHLYPGFIDQVSVTMRFKQYFFQQLRAGITQRVCRPLGYFGSVITHPVSLALLLFVVDKFSARALAIFISVCCIRILINGFLNRTTILNRELSRYLWLVPFNDLMNTFIWMLSFLTDTVYWKERKFRVLKGGKMVELCEVTREI